MRGETQTLSQVETAIKMRGADVYAGFLLPHLRPDMTVLDCGCGEATITLGVAEAVPDGRVVGIDLDKDDLVAGRCGPAAAGSGHRNSRGALPLPVPRSARRRVGLPG